MVATLIAALGAAVTAGQLRQPADRATPRTDANSMAAHRQCRSDCAGERGRGE